MPAVDEHAHRPLSFLPRALSAVALILLLAACVQMPPPPPEIREVRVEVPVPVQVPVVEPGDIAAQQLLSYNDRLRLMNPTELAMEIAPRNDAALPPPAATQLALALLFTHGNGDLVRAQGLLEQVARNNTTEAQAWQPLGRLISSRLLEHRRLEEQIERLNQQARDRDREAQRKLDQLNEKLEALKAIERSLNARPAPAGPAATSASAAKPAQP